MTETWLDFCARRPGPSWKVGYPGVSRRTLAQIEGEVDHSMEGYRRGAYAVLDGIRQASWTFSVYRVGPPEQHYPLEAIPWHAGLPGDRRQDTSLIGNLTLVGMEHEGLREPLTESQFAWSVRISRAIRDLCPSVGARPPALRANLFEHNWLSATNCPSGRIPWGAKIAALQEDGMDQTEYNRMFAEAVRTMPIPRRDEDGDPTSGNHPLASHLEGLFRVAADRSSQEFKAAVWEAMKPVIGPRDETIVRIDREQRDHRGDAAAHSAGEAHKHKYQGETSE